MRNGHVARLLTLGILLVTAGCNKTGTSSDSTNSGSNAPSATSQGSQSASTTSASSPVSAPAAAPVVIPAGKTLTVTVDQDVSTKTNNSGDRFEASLAEPVTVDGNEILARGTRLRGTVTDSEKAGRIKGSGALALTLDSISVHGQTYSIETNSYSEASKSRGKRTVVGGGGGAALGAIVGAVAGGGKGAAIGAVAGGGAGTAGAAYTGNRDLTIPAETRLHFRLRKPLTIGQ